MKKFLKPLIALSVIACVAVVVTATVQWQQQESSLTEQDASLPELDAVFYESFSVEDEDVKLLLRRGLQDVSETAEAGGAALCVKQSLTFGNTMYVSGEFTFEKDVLDVSAMESFSPEIDLSFDDVLSSSHSSGWDTFAPDAERNSLPFSARFCGNGVQFEKGITAVLSVSAIEGSSEDGAVFILDEPLSVTWEIEQMGDAGTELYLDTEEMHGWVTLTPLSLWISMSMQQNEDEQENSGNGHTVSLIGKAGKTVRISDPLASARSDSSGRYFSRTVWLRNALDPTNIKAISIDGEKFAF